MNNNRLSKRLLAVALCSAGLWAGAAAADGYRDHRAGVERHWDRKGDRIERRLDRKGDRIERRLDRRADHLREQGRYAEARRLERKGDRIDRRLDRKGERINRQLDRKGERLARQHGHGYRGHAHRYEYGHKHGHKHGHRHEHRDYRPVYVYPAVPYYYSHDPGVTVAIDLGSWVFRP
jgi:hypothetical protein